MSAGRPGYDRIKIGHDFIKFASENPSCVTVPCYSSTIGISSDIMRDWSRIDNEFSLLYRRAKEIIGLNRLNCTQEDSIFKIDNSLYKGTLHHYDYDVREDIREEKIFESNLRKQEEGAKQTSIYLQVPHGLAIGSNIPTAPVSDESNTSS